jgi:hypothetical protein
MRSICNWISIVAAASARVSTLPGGYLYVPCACTQALLDCKVVEKKDAIAIIATEATQEAGLEAMLDKVGTGENYAVGAARSRTMSLTSAALVRWGAGS